MTPSFRVRIGRLFRGGWPAALGCLLLGLSLSAACRQSSGSPPLTTSPQPQYSPSAARSDSRSKSERIRTDIGFASRQKFFDHYEKHGAEFGSISKEEYLRQAQELRDRPGGGGVLEVRRADGVITRFDRQTGAFLAFNPDLTIRTFFKPNDGETYFIRQSKRPTRRDGNE